MDIFATIQAAAFTDAPHTFEVKEEESEEAEGAAEGLKEAEEEEGACLSVCGFLLLSDCRL